MAVAEIILQTNGEASLTIDGTTIPLHATGDLTAAREEACNTIAEHAAVSGDTMTVTSREPDGVWTFVIKPDGSISEPPIIPVAEEQTTEIITQVPRNMIDLNDVPEPPGSSNLVSEPAAAPAPPAPPAAPATPSRKELREQARATSLLEPDTNELPASLGWRGALNSLGLHLAPSPGELSQRASINAVSQHWAGPRTIAVVNGKGGAGKTPTTILLSAIFARYGGAGVVAYDNNNTRGTLGWRTQQGPHDSTIVELLPQCSRLLSPQAQAAEMAAYVHHQPQDSYDVLRSRPEVLADGKLNDAQSVDVIHSVLTKYYRLVFIDSGNDESSESWRAMIAHADAIVVPTITRPEHAESARLLLNELASADAHSAHLAEEALVIVSQASRAEPRPGQLVETFQQIARAAVGIPYDAAMGRRPLLLDSLAPATRKAWLQAAQGVADGLE